MRQTHFTTARYFLGLIPAAGDNRVWIGVNYNQGSDWSDGSAMVTQIIPINYIGKSEPTMLYVVLHQPRSRQPWLPLPVHEPASDVREKLESCALTVKFAASVELLVFPVAAADPYVKMSAAELVLHKIFVFLKTFFFEFPTFRNVNVRVVPFYEFNFRDCVE